MKIGEYNRPFLRRIGTASRAGNGQVTYSYSDGATYWATIEEPSGKRVENGDSQRTKTDVKIMIRGHDVSLEVIDQLVDESGTVYSLGGITRNRDARETVVYATRVLATPQAG